MLTASASDGSAESAPLIPNRPFSPLSPVFVPMSVRLSHAMIVGASPPIACSPTATAPFGSKGPNAHFGLKAKMAPAFCITDCEWACGFTVSLEEVLQGFSRDASLASRCSHQGFDSADRPSLVRFIVERNFSLPDGGSPLASLYESLCRWDGMPASATPQLLLDVSSSPLAPRHRDPKLLETLLREEAANTPVWFVTRRRCRCQTRLDPPGVKSHSEDSAFSLTQDAHVSSCSPAELGLTNAHALRPLGDGSLFQDSPDCLMRVICQSGATFGWGMEELAGLLVVRRRWGFDTSQSAGRFTAQPLALITTAASARLQAPRNRTVWAFGPGQAEVSGGVFSSVALPSFLPDFW